MMGELTQRDVFWNKVYDLAQADPDVMIVSADMGAPSLDRFRKNLANQYVNVGIAEQNAVLIAAGMALEGKKVFAYAIAPFITYRCFEQIKLYLCAMDLPVTLVGVGAGFSYDDSGPTHHTLEDISLLRMLPKMTINMISDAAMAEKIAEQSVGMTHPNYVRLDRKKMPLIYDDRETFTSGMARIREGSDMVLLAMGNMVHRAMEVSDILSRDNVSASVVDIYSLPVDEERFVNEISSAETVVTMEEHTLPGGFGSAILEVLNDAKCLKPVLRFGLDLSDGYYYRYGGRDQIQAAFNLDSCSIANAILANHRN